VALVDLLEHAGYVVSSRPLTRDVGLQRGALVNSTRTPLRFYDPPPAGVVPRCAR